MAKDKFDAFMSQYSESNASLNSVVDSEMKPAKKAAPKAAPKRKEQEEITVEQRQALAEARNVNRGRPAVGAVKVAKKRIGFEVDAILAEEFKKVSYRTGIPFGQLYEEAMSDLVKKYATK